LIIFFTLSFAFFWDAALLFPKVNYRYIGEKSVLFG